MTTFKVKAGLASTPISNIFIEEYMPKANAVFSVIYIYAFKYALTETELKGGDIADRLNILESDVIKAWEYWAKCGLVKLEGDKDSYTVEFLEPAESKTATVATKAAAKPSPIKPHYSAEEIEELIQSSPQLGQLVQAVEKIHAKPFTPTELSTVIGFSTWLGLSHEVIIILFTHCQGKPMRYIEKTACDWADKGIESSEAAEEYINTHYIKYREIMSAMGISGRTPIEKEKNFMNKWLFEDKMPMELIKLACERTVMKTGKAGFSYADKILSDWKEKGVQTLAQVESCDAAFKQEKAEKKAAKDAKSNPKTNSVPAMSPTKFVNFNQPIYTDEEIEEAIRRKKQRLNK